jgi:hypothetical protein
MVATQPHQPLVKACHYLVFENISQECLASVCNKKNQVTLWVKRMVGIVPKIHFPFSSLSYSTGYIKMRWQMAYINLGIASAGFVENFPSNTHLDLASTTFGRCTSFL